MSYIIEGIPTVRQFGKGWCGYANLEMILRFWGYPISQQDIWHHLRPNEEYAFDGKAYVSMGELALAAIQMTELKVRLATMELYEKLAEKHEHFSPHHVLQSYLIAGVPCMMYHLDHFYVVRGFSDITYTLIDSRDGCRTLIKSHSKFEDMWLQPPLKHHNVSVDTRYALLIIKP